MPAEVIFKNPAVHSPISHPAQNVSGCQKQRDRHEGGRRAARRLLRDPVRTVQGDVRLSEARVERQRPAAEKDEPMVRFRLLFRAF